MPRYYVQAGASILHGRKLYKAGDSLEMPAKDAEEYLACDPPKLGNKPPAPPETPALAQTTDLDADTRNTLASLARQVEALRSAVVALQEEVFKKQSEKAEPAKKAEPSKAQQTGADTPAP